jgi:hypothetical protein
LRRIIIAAFYLLLFLLLSFFLPGQAHAATQTSSYFLSFAFQPPACLFYNTPNSSLGESPGERGDRTLGYQANDVRSVTREIALDREGRASFSDLWDSGSARDEMRDGWKSHAKIDKVRDRIEDQMYFSFLLNHNEARAINCITLPLFEREFRLFWALVQLPLR